MADNLEIWNAVEATNPDFTKGFKRGGGFQGTATNAVYLAKKATHMFGPVGIGWGWKVLDERIVDGHDIVKIHVIRLQVWYIWHGQRGEIEHFGQTEMVGKRSSGPYTDEEAPKKSLTDALSKCLSMLGFSADIFMGLYDDNKYLATIKKEFSSGQEFAPAMDIPHATEPVGSGVPAESSQQGVGEDTDVSVPAHSVAASTGDTRTPDQKADDAIAALAKFNEPNLVTQFMTNKAIKIKLKSLGPDLEAKVTNYARQRHAELKAQPAT